MEKQFTATVYIIDDRKVLLIYHRKLSKWLPPGGHIEPNETPPEAAKREALEETGYHVRFLQDELIWVDRWNARSMERPLLCLLEEIPAYKGTPAHQHMDMIFAATPISQEVCTETQECRWFDEEELLALETDVEIFAETKEVVVMLLNKFANAKVVYA